MSFEIYRKNRDLGIQHSTLCDYFGTTLCEGWREQYREEVRLWLASPTVNAVCETIRREA